MATQTIDTLETNIPATDAPATGSPAFTTQDRSRTQQNSLLMKLPTELRLIIYKMAIQDTVKEIVDHEMSKTLLILPLPQIPQVGSLALPCTSRILREESLPVMKALVGIELDKVNTQYGREGAALEPRWGLTDVHSVLVLLLAHDAGDQLRKVQSMLSR